MSIERLGIMGSGLMGLGIAQAAAAKGFAVLIFEINPSAGKAEHTPQDSEALLDQLTITADLDAMSECDLVVECGREDLTTKVALLRQAESHMTPGAVLATSTASLPLLQLSEHLDRPEQFLGLHFLNPSNNTRIVEIGVSEGTAPGAILAVRAFCKKLGRTPVEVPASSGYMVSATIQTSKGGRPSRSVSEPAPSE
ncbi:MAG: 3-hydroxyacyl-CoA dehydrogenase NAD-binding domain-containing protein [Myxococcota bacterium]